MNDLEREDLVEGLVDDVQHQVMAAIDVACDRYEGSTPYLRELLCIEFGKSLALLGCTFMGNAMGMDADTALQPALDCVAAFKKLAEQKRGSL